MIYLANYGFYKGDNGVGVSSFPPSAFKGKTCKELVPDYTLLQDYRFRLVSRKDVRLSYIKQLKKLDIHKLHKQLDGKVLLTYRCREQAVIQKVLLEWFNRNGYKCKILERKDDCNFKTCRTCKFAVRRNLKPVCMITGELMERDWETSCEEWEYILD